MIIVFVIHSCRKDLNSAKTGEITDPDIMQAKAWYDNTFPVQANTTTTSPVKLSGNNTNTPTDLSGYAKPDWHRGSKYNRFNSAVIEMPMDSSRKITALLKNGKQTSCI